MPIESHCDRPIHEILGISIIRCITVKLRDTAIEPEVEALLERLEERSLYRQNKGNR